MSERLLSQPTKHDDQRDNSKTTATSSGSSASIDPTMQALFETLRKLSPEQLEMAQTEILSTGKKTESGQEGETIMKEYNSVKRSMGENGNECPFMKRAKLDGETKIQKLNQEIVEVRKRTIQKQKQFLDIAKDKLAKMLKLEEEQKDIDLKKKMVEEEEEALDAKKKEDEDKIRKRREAVFSGEE